VKKWVAIIITNYFHTIKNNSNLS